jgi:replicative DNA helicase
MIAAEPVTISQPRALPSSIEAEYALLGIVIYDNAGFEAAETLTAEHFYEPFHGRVWEAISEKIRAGGLAEPLGLDKLFHEDPAYIELGKLKFFADLVDQCPPVTTAGHYAEVIHDLALRRALIRSAEATVADAMDTSTPAVEHLYHAEQALTELAHGAVAESRWESAGAVAREALQEARQRRGMVGLSTGLAELDDAIGGLRSGQMIVVAGRPGMGKSTAALQLGKAVASQGRGVCFFSMEMPSFDLGLRLACDMVFDPHDPVFSPSYFDAARGRLNPDQWQALDRALAKIGSWPLDFDTRPGLTVPVMLAASRRRFRSWERAGVKPGCVIVDHLTIAKADKDRKGNKVAEVGDISRGLAEMAKTLDVPVIALCQLSRDVEKRDKDRRPTLADLRWSGEIEQDARVVSFLYRPEYYVRPPEDDSLEAKAEHREKLQEVRHKLFWLIEKNNNGPTQQVETYCNIAASAIRNRLEIGH